MSLLGLTTLSCRRRYIGGLWILCILVYIVTQYDTSSFASLRFLNFTNHQSTNRHSPHRQYAPLCVYFSRAFWMSHGYIVFLSSAQLHHHLRPSVVSSRARSLLVITLLGCPAGYCTLETRQRC